MLELTPPERFNWPLALLLAVNAVAAGALGALAYIALEALGY